MGHLNLDDLTITESIKLKKNVVAVDINEVWKIPLNYHNRTKQKLNPVDLQVQAQLGEIAVYANTNEMMINQVKTNVV